MRPKRFQFNGEPGQPNDRSAKLTEQQAQQIVDAATVDDAKQLAVSFGITAQSGTLIWKRKTWRHLKRTQRDPDQLELF